MSHWVAALWQSGPHLRGVARAENRESDQRPQISIRTNSITPEGKRKGKGKNKDEEEEEEGARSAGDAPVVTLAFRKYIYEKERRIIQ